MFESGQDHLGAGRYDRVQALARRQLNLEPWREQAYRQLMQAYALAGDRGNALAQFELCRAKLWDEMGVEPAAETDQLYEDIKAGRFGSITATASIHPPVRVRHNLPAGTTPFIGREIESADICRQLTHENQRLVTILAPGGMGKTRLALAAGSALLEQFRDGVTFVNLSPVTEPEGIATATVTILSMMYHHPELIDNHRGKVLDQSAHLREDIGPEAFAAAWEKGKGLDIETVVAQLRLVWTQV